MTALYHNGAIRVIVKVAVFMLSPAIFMGLAFGESPVRSYYAPATAAEAGRGFGEKVAGGGDFFAVLEGWEVRVFRAADGELAHVIDLWELPGSNASTGFASLAMDGNTLVLGVQESNLGGYAGWAHVFDLSGPAPTTPTVTFWNPNGAAGSATFGISVAIDGSRVAVGGLEINSSGTRVEIVYVFDSQASLPALKVITSSCTTGCTTS